MSYSAWQKLSAKYLKKEEKRFKVIRNMYISNQKYIT